MEEHRVGSVILIADDDINVHQSLNAYFKREGYQILSAYDGEEAMKLAKSIKPDMILLDIMMPKKDGLMVCREIRRESNVPIIMLTAKAEEFDKLLGLELGADDYITKPFTLSVLYAKTAALIRRSRGGMSEGDSLRVGELRIEQRSRRVFAGGREIPLTPKEYALLLCLAQNRNMVMSREQLLVKCWGSDFEGETRVVDTQIKRLREKLGRHADCIKTVIKAGYRLEA